MTEDICEDGRGRGPAAARHEREAAAEAGPGEL